MDKIAAYELLLSGHPLWEKIASPLSDAYRRFKPQILAAMNARTPREVNFVKDSFRSSNRLPKGMTQSPLSDKEKSFFINMQKMKNLPKNRVDLQRRADTYRRQYNLDKIR
jgi:hypothetical protein